MSIKQIKFIAVNFATFENKLKFKTDLKKNIKFDPIQFNALALKQYVAPNEN